MTARDVLDEGLALALAEGLAAIDKARRFASHIVGRELNKRAADGTWRNGEDIEQCLTDAARELRHAVAHHHAITTQEKPHADRT